jgi:periplasmic divalent cation tolerance protein
MSSQSARLITVSVPTKKAGLVIAQELLSAKCIACAQVIGPVSSVFRWNGKIDKIQEYILLCKTTPQGSKNAVKKIKDLHSYTCPVIEIVPCTISSAKAMHWLKDCIL